MKEKLSKSTAHKKKNKHTRSVAAGGQISIVKLATCSGSGPKYPQIIPWSHCGFGWFVAALYNSKKKKNNTQTNND